MTLSRPSRRKEEAVRPSGSPLGALLGGSLLFAVAVVGLLFWLAGQLSGLLSGNGWPDSSPADIPAIAVRVVGNPGKITSAWPPSAAPAIGPTWLVLVLFLLLLAALGVALSRVVRFMRNFRRRREFRMFRLGFASVGEVRDMLSAETVIKKAHSVRPSLKGASRVDPKDVGFYLGRDLRSRQELYASIEDVFIVLAPPRQGKDVHFCAPYTIDAPGPCIVTSTRSDAFTNTYAMRSKVGKVYVFDPNGLTGWPEQLRWSPVRGCEDPQIAVNRANAFVMGSGLEPSGPEAYYVLAAVTILQFYLHAAALAGYTVKEILTWAGQPTNPEAAQILRRFEATGEAAPTWASRLEQMSSLSGPMRDAVWAFLIQGLALFSDPKLIEACSPGPDEAFDLSTFLAGRNTLYVLGKDKKTGSIAPLVTAMMEDFFDETRKIASAMAGSRLDPPLTVELNEVAHIAPLPNLPAYMGDSGGFSIALHVYLQSLSQARSKWGEHGAMVMWDNAAVRVIMGGAGNVEDLEDISRLMGQVRTESRLDKLMQGKRPPGTEHRVLTPEEIRTLKFGTAVVVARAARPVEVTLTPWWKRKDGPEIATGKARVEDLLLQYRVAKKSTPSATPKRSPAALPGMRLPADAPPVGGRDDTPVLPPPHAGRALGASPDPPPRPPDGADDRIGKPPLPRAQVPSRRPPPLVSPPRFVPPPALARAIHDPGEEDPAVPPQPPAD